MFRFHILPTTDTWQPAQWQRQQSKGRPSPAGCLLFHLQTFLSAVVELLYFDMELIAIALAALGFISIVGSIFIWNIKKGETAEEKAHAERFGIFIGLWAPTFFALAVLAKVI